MCLSASGIFYSWESFVLWFLLRISHGNFTVHSSNIFLFTRLPVWAVGFCAFSNDLFTISFTRSKAISVLLSVSELFTHYSKLTSLFTLLLLWCSAFENSSGLHFSVYTSILFLSISRVTSFLYNDHLNTLDGC